ncbi:16386_t:CDS:2 [Dentiscutata erythropus]|uniref:16386_t:CDS:1 n=1 Tax=Dentiscutata erythropus TaxID=1348616 RepID=A0A9N9A7Q0_9GLOM|nr:16386_t:CDS:2 [Dentiscutata erythropus]
MSHSEDNLSEDEERFDDADGGWPEDEGGDDHLDHKGDDEKKRDEGNMIQKISSC